MKVITLPGWHSLSKSALIFIKFHYFQERLKNAIIPVISVNELYSLLNMKHSCSWSLFNLFAEKLMFGCSFEDKLEASTWTQKSHILFDKIGLK